MYLSRDQFFEYQEQAYRFGMDVPCTAWWINMGLGKTAPALTVIKDLLDEWAVTKVLVIAPKIVAESTWPDEANNWEHLRDLRFSVMTGGTKKMLAGLEKDADVYTINPENVEALVNHFKAKWPFDMVVIDESSKFKSPSAKRFRALKKIVKRGLIDRMIQLTGSPAPNGLLDVWAPMFLLDRGEALGRTYTGYRDTFFVSDYMGYNFEIVDGAEERIYERLDGKVMVIKGSNTDEPVMNNIMVPLSPQARKQYEDFEKELVLQVTDGTEIEAVNSAVLTQKLQQFTSGNVYHTDEETDVRTVKALHNAKMDALERVISEAEGQPVLVGYSFKHERDAIKAKFPKAREFDGKNDRQLIKDWNAGKIPLLIGHPASMGHGLNLQHGGHIAVWYGLTWSLELYEQFIKRLDRTGQKEQVIVHHLICKDTVDETIIEKLQAKDATQQALTKAIADRMKRRLQKLNEETK